MNIHSTRTTYKRIPYIIKLYTRIDMLDVNVQDTKMHGFSKIITLSGQEDTRLRLV